MAAPRGVSPLPDRSASEPCPVSENELAALKAEITQLRRQASFPPSRQEAVLREAALREAALREAERRCLLTALPEELLQHIVDRIQLAHHIAPAAPTCRVISVAVCNALKARPFSSEVVTLDEHDAVLGVAAAPDGRVITGLGWYDNNVTVWRERTVKISGRIIKVWNERTIEAHTEKVVAVVLTPPQAARASSASRRTHRRTREAVHHRRRARAHFDVDSTCLRRGAARQRALCGRPWGSLFPARSGCTTSRDARPHLRGAPARVPVAVTPDGQHIISGSVTSSSRCGASPARAS